MAKKTTAQPIKNQALALDLPKFLGNTRLLGWAFFAAAILLYANSLTSGFVLDDSTIITKNSLTKLGFAAIPEILAHDMNLATLGGDKSTELVAGGRYRPLSSVVFAIWYQFFGDNPLPYHALLVLSFALICLVFYRTALRLFGESDRGKLVATLGAALFVVHPIHTEVANNVKCLDETMSLLFSLLTLNFALRAQTNSGWKWPALAGLMFLIACFSKENAIPFALLIPLTLWLKNAQTNQSTSQSIAKICLPIWLAGAAFIAARVAVLGWSTAEPPLSLINNSFIKWAGDKWEPFSFAERYATIAYTLGKYLLLMLWPHPLSTDYYPRAITIHTFKDQLVVLAVLANAGLLAWAAWRIFKKKFEPSSWGIFAWFSTLFVVSNIPFAIGTNMAERFAFMPSAGGCLALGGLLAWLTAQNWRVGLGLTAAICAVFAVLTVLRNPDFRSNKTLFTKDIQVSANSAKCQAGLGGIQIKEARNEQDETKRVSILKEAILHFNKAVELNPTYAEAFYARGSANFLMRNFVIAAIDFEKALALSADRPEVKNNLAAACLEAGKILLEKDPAKAAPLLKRSNELFPNNPETQQLLQRLGQ